MTIPEFRCPDCGLLIPSGCPTAEIARVLGCPKCGENRGREGIVLCGKPDVKVIPNKGAKR